MAKLKLDKSMIEVICQCLKLRMKWKQIAAHIGVDPTTLRKWIVSGEKAKSGIKRDLVLAIERTKAELYEDYSAVVRNAILFGSETTTRKVRTDAEGKVYREEVTKQTGPNAGLAMKVLALMQPEVWAPVQHIKVDWRESVKDLNVDPHLIEEAFFRLLEMNKDAINGNHIPIPKIPGRTV